MVDAAAATRLFLELVTDGAVHAADLEPVRHCTGLRVRSVAVNGERVDVVAGDDVDEWRVVFGVAPGPRIEWVEVYRRPRYFAGIANGRALLVNGPSSVGKSTLLVAVQDRSDAPWVVFDEPHLGSVRPEHLIWRHGREVLHRGFLDGIAALARAGNFVAVAAGGHPQSSFDAAFAGVPTLRVGLHCAAAELERREQGRRDVCGGLAVSSIGVHVGWAYDLTFRTDETPLDAMADEVASAVERLSR